MSEVPLIIIFCIFSLTLYALASGDNRLKEIAIKTLGKLTFGLIQKSKPGRHLAGKNDKRRLRSKPVKAVESETDKKRLVGP